MQKIDLHIHSSYSDDGEFSVREIMNMCQAEQISYMAITDHNSVRAVPEALALAESMNIKVIPGVELDCIHVGRNFHVLGYHIDPSDPDFSAIEHDILRQEQAAALKKIELISKVTGIPVSAEAVLARAKNGAVTGELIAEILLEKENAAQYSALLPYLPGGKRSDNPDVNFYWDYFSQGKPAYVPIEYISLNEAISLIHRTGGIAVLAHPGQNLKNDFAFVEKMIACGLDGIEAYSSYHSKEEAQYFKHVALNHKLLITCGSDFHGKTKPSIPLCGHGAGECMDDIGAKLT